VVNKLPHLADRLSAGPGQGVPGQGVPGQGVPGHSVERVGKVAHGLALRGTETFLAWMERLLHFLDSDDTGENMFFVAPFERLNAVPLVSTPIGQCQTVLWYRCFLGWSDPDSCAFMEIFYRY
jgi:hypothetical protein